MPISAVLPTTLDFPHRGELARDDFVNAQEASQDILAGSWTTNANLFATEANALEANVNAKEASAVSASISAIAASNFKGTWTNQTTAIGQSWEYGGVIYGVLIAGNTSPVATPSNWFALTIASQIKNIPAGNISATTVQEAINELDTEKAKVGNVPIDIHVATSKTTPVDADELGICDSATSFTLKKLTWANLKASVVASLGLLISGLTARSTPTDSDVFLIGDSSSTFASKSLTFLNLKTTLNATWVANDSRAMTSLNATGSAPIYACRAFVNFNGTGTVSIRASGNLSSITDNSTGDYTLNFTTAMPDANYTVNIGQASFGFPNTGNGQFIKADNSTTGATLKTTTQLRVWSSANSSSAYDSVENNISIFR